MIEPAGPSVGWPWELAQLLGLAAACGTLVLCVFPVRPRRPATRPLSLPLHEALGWGLLTAATAHAAGLLAADHLVGEHLRLTAPLYEWAGILALALMLVLTVPATASLRQRLWKRHRNFQFLHVALTALLVLATAVHVVATDRYVHGRVRVSGYVLLSVAALAALLRLRARRPTPPAAAQQLVFGRHARGALLVVSVCALALMPLLVPGASRALREGVVARTRSLPVDFPHERHRAVSCVLCHHDFLDMSGPGSCISCHRSARADLRAGAEARFHDFCLGCHRDPPAQFEHHGPRTGCASCHVSLTS